MTTVSFLSIRDFYYMLVPNQTDLIANHGSHLNSSFLVTTQIHDFWSVRELSLLPEPNRVGSKIM